MRTTIRTKTRDRVLDLSVGECVPLNDSRPRGKLKISDDFETRSIYFFTTRHKCKQNVSASVAR